MHEHSEFLPRLAAFHDGELSAGERKEVEAHLERCPECRRLLAEWNALDGALKDLPEPALPEYETRNAILAAIAEQSPVLSPVGSTRRPIYLRPPAWLAAAAAVVLVAAALIMQHKESPLFPERKEIAGEAPAVAPTERIPAENPPAEAQPPEVSPAAGPLAQAKTEELANEDETAAPAAPKQIPAATSFAATETKLHATAPEPAVGEDSGIPQRSDWPARLFESIPIHYRLPDLLTPEIVEPNLLPVYAVTFEPVGYATGDLLALGYDATVREPIRLTPEEAYLVANLRLESAALLARLANQAGAVDLDLRLAEVTWRLANITADRDDVRSAIVAQTNAMRKDPAVTDQSLARIAHLQSLME